MKTQLKLKATMLRLSMNSYYGLPSPEMDRLNEDAQQRAFELLQEVLEQTRGEYDGI